MSIRKKWTPVFFHLSSERSIQIPFRMIQRHWLTHQIRNFVAALVEFRAIHKSIRDTRVILFIFQSSLSLNFTHTHTECLMSLLCWTFFFSQSFVRLPTCFWQHGMCHHENSGWGDRPVQLSCSKKKINFENNIFWWEIYDVEIDRKFQCKCTQAIFNANHVKITYVDCFFLFFWG